MDKNLMPTAPYLLVVGSSNTDMVIRTKHLPAPGETVLGDQFFMNAGGKGANQAVAAVRLGGNVCFICKTGKDVFGERAAELFRAEGINTNFMLVDPLQPSGVALITVDHEAENCIVVASGANNSLSISDLIPSAPVIKNASMVLMQLEIPLSTVEFVAQTAYNNQVAVVLNPAPAAKLPDELLSKISVITPNESEASLLTGIKVNNLSSAKDAARAIHEKGVPTVIITLGAEGALIFDHEEFTHVPTNKVKAVDTTAAGDIFNGALAVALSRGESIIEATTFACRAAAISVTRMGAQASAPYQHELQEVH